MNLTYYRHAFMIVFLLCAFTVPQSKAMTITPDTISIAKEGFPIVTATLRDASILLKTSTNLLYLPQGIIKTALAPTPFTTLAGGLKDIAFGINAGAHVVGQVIKAPFNLLNRTSSRLQGILL